MNYHRVQFAINGLGTVAEYDAGLAGAPAIASHPQTQGWNTNLPTVATAVTNAPVSPDGVLLPCRAIAFVDSDWAGSLWATDPDGAGPATSFGWDAFATYEEAQEAICDNGTIQVVRGDIKIVGLEADTNTVRVVWVRPGQLPSRQGQL